MVRVFGGGVTEENGSWGYWGQGHLGLGHWAHCLMVIGIIGVGFIGVRVTRGNLIGVTWVTTVSVTGIRLI